MKAFAVFHLNWHDSGAFLVAAESANAAKRSHVSDWDGATYFEMRAWRCPGADRFIDPAWSRTTDMESDEAMQAAGFNNEGF